ncbi:MAG TPA: Gfo/Idh/MocA family oxidoreductase [Candidatus Saccharimonadales bacterium]|nr:Gfo/Idh/MocA family oxidoreductase [Candidatus Saccharimonadales bacterium]
MNLICEALSPLANRQAGGPPARHGTSRRAFIRSVAKTAAVSLATLDISRFAHAAGSDVIRLGLVGCGGRGSGAVRNALASGKDVKLVAMADVADWRIKSALDALRKARVADQIQVNPERKFVGFNSFQNLLASGVDAVILATPPGFRPLHFAAAVSAGVHCFLEKPVAVDAPGVRQIRVAAERGAQKGLSSIVGIPERFNKSYQQFIAEISHGAIGRIDKLKAIIRMSSAAQPVQRGDLDRQLRRNATEMEFQIRNWVSFAWLSGDKIAEMLVHQIDSCLWACGRPPQSASGSAARREHTRSDYGDTSDFMSVQFSFGDGTQCLAEICALAGAIPERLASMEGDKGVAVAPNRIVGRQGETIWSYQGPNVDAYQAEMNEWCASIRQRNPLNTVASGADSTLMAIMGRTAAYTGRTVTWDDIQRSTETFFVRNPKSFEEDPPCLPDKFGDYQTPPRGILTAKTPRRDGD